MALALSPLGPNLENLHFLELTLLYKKVRSFTLNLCAPLEVEDTQIQSMPDVSPPKWHLAHTTWFFENFVLLKLMKGYQPFHPKFHYIFNSYYKGLGPHYPRNRRGLLSRPTLREVHQYREWVDSHIFQLLSSELSSEAWEEMRRTLTLAVHHEQQHQELLVADIKHILWSNPLRPAYHHRPALHDRGLQLVTDGKRSAELEKGGLEVGGGIQAIGADEEGFAFDNELPVHRVSLEPFRLSRSPVTNGEYLEFIEAGGYSNPLLWLSDGWDAVNREGWEAPLYWERDGSAWQVYTLAGMQPLQEEEPVCHISFFEADAFARWRGARLPTEFEWERVAREHASGLRGSSHRNFAESGRLHPAAAEGPSHGREPVRQLLGDVWEWTASAYLPYPGFRPFDGEFGEYNGKFMSGQMVLRGGSCATPRDHIRVSYRNFFPPAARWQFSGARLAG